MPYPAIAHRHPLLHVALALAALAISLLLLSHSGPAAVQSGSQRLDVSGVLLAACSALPLAVWWRAPLAVFGVSAAAGVVLAGLDYPVNLLPGPLIALYLLAAHRQLTHKAVAVVVALLVAYLTATAVAEQAFPGVGLIHTALPWAAAWFAGERTRLRREQVADLRQHALQDLQLAVAEERARIARDLHDSAGHAMSLIAVRAGAARLRQPADPARLLDTLRAVEDLARQTVEDIDHFVGSLRERGELEAPVGLASLDTLISHHAAAGLQVKLDVTGSPQPLGGAVDQAVYRILQQALTNAAHHGNGGVRVHLAYTGTGVELTVTNPVRTSGTPRPGGGHGVIGMRERATLIGGTLETVRADGTFRLVARIPHVSAPPPELPR